MGTWKEEVTMLLKNLGGHAYLNDIYNEFLNSHTKDITPNYKASIRDALEKGSLESEKYDGNGVLFYMVEGKNRGHYGIVNYEVDNSYFTQDDDEFSEGKLLLAKHIRRERNQYLITKAKRNFINENGHLYCEACGFDFEEKYGELGCGFIEAHHTKPVSQMQEGEKTKLEDIVMLCSNCHSMVHRKKPWLNKEKIINFFN